MAKRKKTVNFVGGNWSSQKISPLTNLWFKKKLFVGITDNFCGDWYWLQGSYEHGGPMLPGVKIYIYTQIKVKKQCYHCCSTFHSHNGVFNIEHKHISYLKLNVKHPLACSWVLYLTSVDKHYIWSCLLFWCFLLYRIVFLITEGFFSVSEMISIIREKICVLLDKPDLSTTVKNTLEIDMKKPQLKLNHVKVKLSEKATAQIESCQGKVVWKIHSSNWIMSR